ncbi:hypothetical protein EZ428_23585 [Pedobacter frigiditerrae]|uniref:Uncharacterized protein n=1 Tax=Pedobacter frigiditerrae TaxID=2530452 RepID=A0A4R0MJW0_9SPHI|nr:hypothetical protein [Pedobacter frigiditerrae]TCC86452.1 hypothetical protein EZ428_23585 [Pedobacter frigiditerrae]
MTDFKPPIATRTTKELLKIVGAIEKWNGDAVEQARKELKLRNVPQDQIRHAEYLSKKADKYEDLKRAKESYAVGDFIFEPAGTLFEVLFSWELKKDGYLKKAEQQKRLRLVFGLLILTLIIYVKLAAD